MAAHVLHTSAEQMEVRASLGWRLAGVELQRQAFLGRRGPTSVGARVLEQSCSPWSAGDSLPLSVERDSR